MARAKERFSPVELARLARQPNNKTRMHHDGGGLYLTVDSRGLDLILDEQGRYQDSDGRAPSASWVFRYMHDGRARTAGLGPFPTVGLADARKIANGMRRTLKVERTDPLELRESERSAKRVAAAKAMTFRECGVAYIASHSAGWKNAKHAAQWGATLETYAYPLIGELPVSAVDVALVMQVLEQQVGDPPARLWVAKSETASRLRGRMEAVLGWAEARGLRAAGDNPAAWKGRLQHQLPASSKVAKVKHHAALSIDAMHSFWAELAARDAMSARALEFTILAAARTDEVLASRWSEIDFKAKVWTIPENRMKKEREHHVPLTDAALAVLRKVMPEKQDPADHVFPGAKLGRPLSNMAMLNLLQERMGYEDYTVHGFRSTFRDWAAERTSFARELVEKALAHSLKDKSEAAYQRSNLLEARRPLMEAWARWCEDGPPVGDNVTDLDTARGAA